MQIQILETTFEIKKVYLKIVKQLFERPTFPRHYDMIKHFPIVRI